MGLKSVCEDIINRVKLITLEAEERYLIFILFLSALCNGLYEIAIIKEFTVTTHSVHTSAYLFFAFTYIFFGLGSYIAYRFFDLLIRKEWIKRIFLLSGITIIFSLLSSLKMDVSYGFSVVSNIFLVCLVIICFGIISSVIIIYFTRRKDNRAATAVFFSIIGLITGFILEPFAAVYLGVNATCLILGVSLVFLYIKFTYSLFFILTGIILSLNFPLDRYVEKLRVKKIDVNYRETPQRFAEKYEEIFNGWSPYSKLNIYLDREKNRILGAYNYKIFWVASKKSHKYEGLPYNFVGKHENVLIIGASAGKEIYRFSPGRIISKDNTTMVEIDPLVVRYFKDLHPEYNDNLFNRVNIIAADGRSVLDEMTVKQDVIIIGSLESAASNVWMLTELKNHLFTIESILKCFQILNKDGVLMVYQDYFAMIHSLRAALDGLHIPYVLIKLPYFYKTDPPRERYFLYASRDEKRLARIEEGILSSGIALPCEIPEAVSSILTDDKPFMNFLGTKKAMIIETLIKCLGLIFVLLFLSLFTAGRKINRGKLLYFFLIGNGFFLTQLLLLSKFRSFFSHPLKTIVIVSVLFLSFSAIGSLLSERINIGNLRNKLWRNVFIVCIVLAYSFVVFERIPFSVGNYPLKILAGLLIILPMGIICGIFYPLGLTVNRNGNLGLALFLDGLGTCSAFLLFYIVCALFGISFNFYPIVFCYLSAVFLISL